MRYWWVAVKLVMNVLLCVLIVVALRPGMADVGAAGVAIEAGEVPVTDHLEPRVPARRVSLTMLAVATVLSVYKPWGPGAAALAGRRPGERERVEVPGRVPVGVSEARPTVRMSIEGERVIEVRDADPAEYEAVGKIVAEAFVADGQLDAPDSVFYAGRPARRRGPGRRRGDHRRARRRRGGRRGDVRASGGPMADIAGDGEAEIRMLGVAPDAQGRGAGYRADAECLARAAGRSGTAASGAGTAANGRTRQVVLSTRPSPTVRTGSTSGSDSYAIPPGTGRPCPAWTCSATCWTCSGYAPAPYRGAGRPGHRSRPDVMATPSRSSSPPPTSAPFGTSPCASQAAVIPTTGTSIVNGTTALAR